MHTVRRRGRYLHSTQQTERRGFRNRHPRNRAAADRRRRPHGPIVFAGTMHIVRMYTCALLDVSSVQDFQLDTVLFAPTHRTFLPPFDHPNNVYGLAQILKVITMQVNPYPANVENMVSF